MDLSAPVDEGTPPRPHPPKHPAYRIDELESFRSRWRQEIQKGRESRSPIRTRTAQTGESESSYNAPSQESSPRQSEEHSIRVDANVGRSPLEVYENAILKERQGSLSEAVMQYRKAFKVYIRGRRMRVNNRWTRMLINIINRNIFLLVVVFPQQQCQNILPKNFIQDTQLKNTMPQHPRIIPTQFPPLRDL